MTTPNPNPNPYHNGHGYYPPRGARNPGPRAEPRPRQLRYPAHSQPPETPDPTALIPRITVPAPPDPRPETAELPVTHPATVPRAAIWPGSLDDDDYAETDDEVIAERRRRRNRYIAVTAALIVLLTLIVILGIKVAP